MDAGSRLVVVRWRAEARSASVSRTAAMSSGEDLDASQYMMPVGMKKSWNDGEADGEVQRRRQGALQPAEDATLTTPVPAARPTPLTRLPRLNTVPRCSGGFTSVMSANQLGELAEVSASASRAVDEARPPSSARVTTLRSTPPTTVARTGAVGHVQP